MVSSAHQHAGGVPALPPNAPLVRLAANIGGIRHEAESSLPVLLIGSRRDCHLPIADTEISKVHAAICNNGSDILVCDLRSRAGTFLNGKRILAGTIRPGDRLRVGPIEISTEFLRAPAGWNGRRNPLQSGMAPQPFPYALTVCGNSGPVTLPHQPAVIGRRNNCDVILDTPDVSLAHALLFMVGSRPMICDLGSRSGTLVNGERVALVPVQDGDELTIGGEKLTIRWSGPQPSAETAQAYAASPQPVQAVPVAAAPAVAARATPAVPFGSPAAAAGLQLPETPDLASMLKGDPLSDLGNLEQFVTGVQAQLLKLRAELNERSAELSAREDSLAGRAEELASERAALDTERRELGDVRTALEVDRAEVDRKRGALAAATKEIQQRSQQITLEQTQLEAARQQLDSQRSKLVAEQAERQRRLADAEQAARQREAAIAAREKQIEELVKQREATARARLEQAQQALAQREAALATRLQQLEQREQALAQRELTLEQREQQVALRETASLEAANKIQHIKQALASAAAAFGTMEMPGAAAAAELSPPDAAAAKKNAPQLAATSTRESVAGGLPAPLVDRPLFAAQQQKAAQAARGLPPSPPV